MIKIFWSVLAALAVFLVVIVVFKPFRSLDLDQGPVVVAEAPLRMEFSTKLKPGVIAVLKDHEITESSLLEKSKSLEDYQQRELLMLVDAVVKKLGDKGAKEAVKIEAFMASPYPQFNTVKAGIPENIEITFSPRRTDDKVLKLDGTELGRPDLPLNQVRFSELKNQQLQENVNVLQGVFSRAMLLIKAKEANTNIEGLIQKQVIQQEPTVTEEEVDAFMQKNGVVLKPTEKKLRAQIQNIVLEHKRKTMIDDYIKSISAGETAYVAFRPPTYMIPISDKQTLIRAKNSSDKGPTLFVFSDFLCSPCIQLAEELQSLRSELKDKVRIGFVHLFSESNWQSRLLAEASFCLNHQRPELFWAFYDRVTKEPAKIDEEKIHEISREIGADHDNFQSCLLAQTFKEDVNNQLKYAHDLGITTPPTVIIGQEVFSGTIRREQLLRALGLSSEIQASK